MKILSAAQEKKANIEWVEPTDIPFQAWVDELVLMEIKPRCAADAFHILQKHGYGNVMVMGYLTKGIDGGVEVGGMIHMNFRNTNPTFIKHISELTGLRGDQTNAEQWTEFEDE